MLWDVHPKQCSLCLNHSQKCQVQFLNARIGFLLRHQWQWPIFVAMSASLVFVLLQNQVEKLNFSDCPRAKYGRESDRNDYLKLFLLPLRWHLNVPFEMYSKIRKMVLHALGLSWWVMMQCPIMLTKWRCLSLEITSMCSVKLCIAWLCLSLKHLTAANEPSLILPLYSWRQKKSFQVKRITK